MRSVRICLPAFLLGWFSFFSAAVGADFHPVSSVSTSTEGDLWTVSNLIQGPGVGFDSEEPHDQLGSGSSSRWVTGAPGGFPSDYIAVAGGPVLIFDLGSDVALSEVSAWGYSSSNANGVSALRLRFATSAEGASGFADSIVYSPEFSLLIGDVARQSFPFSQTVIARYVELSCLDNFYANGGSGPPAGGDRVGLGEVAFEVSPGDPNARIGLPPNLGLELDGSVQNFDVPVGNLGSTQILELHEVTFSGSQSAAFSIVAAPGSISPGETDLIQISFNPTGLTGMVSAELEVNSNDISEPIARVVLSGFLHDPRLVVDGVLDFGILPAGSEPETAILQLSNQGGGQNLILSELSVEGPDADHFGVTSAPATLLPLSGEELVLSFDPAGREGTFAARLIIRTNDAVDPIRSIDLSARVGEAIPNSGIRINEIMASNGQTLSDGDGNSPDWIELFNAGPGAVDLTGWHLTDDASEPEKWRFPEVSIPENGYLVVFASGQDRDDYVDANGSLHTNFRLTTGGEYLALVGADGNTVVSELAPAFPPQFNDISYGSFQSGGELTSLLSGSNAQVFIPGDGALGNSWQARGFVPGAGWINGVGQGVGYDTGSDFDSYITTDIESEMRLRGTSAFIRIPFEVADASAVSALSFSFRYDDGFVAYLNGTEIATRNAPAFPAWNAVASSSVNERANAEVIDISAFAGELQTGSNVLAVHGLNQSLQSSDFLVDVALEASSVGNGPLSFGYLEQASPGAANSGSTTPGPTVSAVTHAPDIPQPSQNIVVTAVVEPRLAEVSSVELTYRIDYGAATTVAMTGEGDIFTAVIPSSVYRSGDMVRWFVRAIDVDGNAGRAPVFLDQTGNNQSPEYFGTVVQNARLTSDLPILQWFTQSESASNSRSGARASVFFGGRFYDNIFVRKRGGATNGSSQKFNFNKGEGFYINEDMPAVGEINMNARGSDSTYVRQTLAFETYQMAGNASCNSALWYMQLNGSFDRIGVFIEQVDEDFLERNGYNPDSDLYKFVQRSNLNPVFYDTVTGIEKKTGDKSDLGTVSALVAGLNQRSSAGRRRYVIDNLDIPQILNYLAVRSITQDADDVRKNFYGYVDSRGDQRWRIFPWDKDWTFGVTGDGGTYLSHPFFGDEEHAKQNANQWNVLYDVLFEETTTQRLYLRRLRTVMDELLQPANTPGGDRILEARAAGILEPASPPLSGSVSSINNYLNSRRSVLYGTYRNLIPGSQPSNPDLRISGVDYNPASGNQDEEYVLLTNNEDTEIDVSGWSVTGGIEMTLAPGTVIERRGELYLSPDTLVFRNRQVSPKGNEERLVVGPYSGHLSNFGETLTLRNQNELVVSTYNTPVDPSDPQRYLVVSEIMYHPHPDRDAEFIEVMNISEDVSLDLSGVRFTAGIEYSFPAGTMLAPGERFLVPFDSFENGSRLSNGSDRIKLEDASNSTIREFTYKDGPRWPAEADGNGFSIVLMKPTSNPDHDSPGNWRGSVFPGGSPGDSDGESFAGNPDEDLDGDGYGAFFEYATGSSDAVPGGSPLFLAEGPEDRLVLTFKINQGADEVSHRLMLSTDLRNWTEAGADYTLLSRVNNGDGTATLVYQSPPGSVNSLVDRRFLRVEFTLP